MASTIKVDSIQTDTGNIAFSTVASERLRIDNNGNVGIGTVTPGYKLEVKGASATAGQLSIHDGTGDTTVSGTNAASLLFQARNTSVRTIAEIDVVNTTTNGTGGAMVFQTRISDTLAERMRIDSSGNVGIGTSSPGYKLTINTSAGTASFYTTDAATSDFMVTPGAASGVVRVGPVSGSMAFYSANSERMRIDSSGNIGVNNSNPIQYVSSGKVVNITGTTTNSGPANLYMSGSPTTLGSGFSSTEVFAITGVAAATEITRITGTGANGFRAYFKITVTGHTTTIGNGINIKEFYWDAATSAPVQISTYTNGVGTPTISFDNTTSNVCIINLASSNGTNEYRGVMKVEWMSPVDFSNNTWTIT